MTKPIRLHSGLGLAAAKGATDALLDGQAVAIDCTDAEAAAVLLRGAISPGVARGELGDAAGARAEVR